MTTKIDVDEGTCCTFLLFIDLFKNPIQAGILW